MWFVDDMLTQLETKLGLEVGRIGIEVLIEGVQALAGVDEIASCSPRLEALILGVGDGAANLNGMMIDATTTRLFEVTLDRARRCGLLDAA